MTGPRSAMDALRGQLADARGPRYWRALEELIEQPAWRSRLQEAFPQLSRLEPKLDRRGFLKLLGASLALAGLGACSRPPQEQIVPWVRRPDQLPPALPRFYASTLACAGDVAGVLVETHQGRPTKIEGNPAHPMSLGATTPAMQAAVLELWDPDRSQGPVHEGVASSWDAFGDEVRGLAARFARDGRGLHVLSGRLDSPTLAAQRDAWLARFPGAQWHAYEAIDEDNALAGAQLAFGKPLCARHHLDRAQVIVSLEADFLASMPGSLRHGRDFITGRDPASDHFNRLYVVEASPTLTGAKADHRWPLASAQVGTFALELGELLGLPGVRAGQSSGIPQRRLRALAQDLDSRHGGSLVLAGRTQPPWVHALAHLLNEALGNVGRTVEYYAPVEPWTSSATSLHELTEAMADGRVDTLLILDGNPAYATPVDAHFATHLAKVRNRIHLGLYRDETAVACQWHLPCAHPLESWSDLRAADGTASAVQPVIAPLYDARSAHELLAMFLGDGQSPRARVQATWRAQAGTDPEAFWTASLQQGVIARSAPPAQAVQVDHGFLARIPAPADQPGLELLFAPDPTVWDGRYANNGWLQECPKPLTTLTWSNVALVSPELALAHDIKNGDAIELRIDGRHTQAPAWIMPGQAARSITVLLGYGRRHAGRLGEQLGFDAYALRSTDAPWRTDGLRINRTGAHYALATTQRHHTMEGRAPVRNATLDAFRTDPAVAQAHASVPPSLYPDRPHGEYAWGMSVDLNACIGCGACTIACQAENNIPVVGAEEVERGREMHWIRIDRYYEGDARAPRIHHQPVPCMHCEHAPCEVVCPVGATVHDSEGLNVQVYNRCVGTRFCSNNCPYKVRRFNFLQYSDLHTETLKAQRNPDVSVRNRGVMEKCTYCIQRIETAHVAADREGRRIADGEVLTACQAVCPTQAIVFGDQQDPASAVSRQKASPRNYALLEELNTRPHTTYLAAIRNPHPALEDDA
ncbi:TAT-variant-translocated molybdopterin oxidoreductase [Frateuria terrea]|uniref:Quinol:cytochrome c oxidoreductase iron-sulfur protein n=1 Tax=Frateuria terrea TaxID=529704 RepID=A0A1H6SL02_9GAMM|nr:TAT-variant-translocated molybdopterin oxidoreductase [Frateuria terrea]SEI68618.1 quinol:cytochrome c oxidoreductase iron-sulfur protein precursor [Frateuria terrea]SFP27174.1 quinol:cytochrome c oxidoreductase iron-sulfur protein precursor [Frateuria terrea]